MKIAISLPEHVFRGVERQAKRLGISRSELLARAATEFLAERRGEDITASYDRAYAEPGSEADERLRRQAARLAFRKLEW